MSATNQGSGASSGNGSRSNGSSMPPSNHSLGAAAPVAGRRSRLGASVGYQPSTGRTSRRGPAASNATGGVPDMEKRPQAPPAVRIGGGAGPRLRLAAPAATELVSVPGAVTSHVDTTRRRQRQPPDSNIVEMQHRRWKDYNSRYTPINMAEVRENHRTLSRARMAKPDPLWDDIENEHPLSPVLSPPPTPRRAIGTEDNKKTTLQSAKSDNIMRGGEKDAFNPNETQRRPQSMLGGFPIDMDTAKRLRSVVYGSLVHGWTRAWRSAGLVYQQDGGPAAWGLRAERGSGGCHGLLMALQAVIVRHLVFKYNSKADIYANNPLSPSPLERRQAAWRALADVLWRAGGRRRAAACLPPPGPGKEAAWQQTAAPAEAGYRADGLTERLRLYEFDQLEDLERFMKRNLSYYEAPESSGLVCFLYSVALSRTLPKLSADLGVFQPSLLNSNEGTTLALVNLVLTGRASPHLHNLDVLYDAEGELLEHPLLGIPERGDVGLLYWDKEEEDNARTMVGSMLKTPKRPVWVTLINGHWGVLFCTNPELVGNWRSEHWFALHYYTGEAKDVTLKIDTRHGRSALNRIKSGRRKREEEKKIPSLERCIMTKWYGCSVDWNGVMPFV